ncbi:hypothetical protein L861_09700 [Litchfieldella anticariensis FP35 = DSM 16096]|uniref:NERD domain-containing protein n=2 Tax=Litchfieldella anticariensis TaxID=258591 RepID=S2KKB9_LITA3|nr:hypothetical protein L861_09700 [Halomonas anticariensis FP35 = DSM 16096]
MLGKISLDSFVDAVLRNENLIVQDGNVEKVLWVVDYLGSLIELIKAEYPKEHAGAVRRIAILLVINNYFNKLYEWRSETEAVKSLSAPELVSASLIRGAEDYLVISKKAVAALREGARGKAVIDTHLSYLIEDSIGNRIHPDSAMSMLFDSIFLIMKSTGFIEGLKENNCFDFKRFYCPSEDDIYKIGALNLNAMSWKFFDSLQKDIRHCERGWSHSDNNEDVPEEHKEHVKEYLDISSPLAWRIYEIIAEQRIRQLAKEIYFTTLEHLSMMRENDSEAYLNRVANNIVIERILSIDPGDEKNKCLGLTLSQWIEGYAVLQEFVRSNYNDDDASSLVPLLGKVEIIDLFVSKGIPIGIADTFLNNVIFGPGSFDLYDTPVIRFGDLYMIYGPVLKDAILYELVVSNVGRNKEKLAHKGDALEYRLLHVFKEAGLNPKKFKEMRGKEEYEFDLLVKWNDFLFVFECKNRAIPRSPVLSRNMIDDYKEHIGQLKRLCAGLDKYPDMVEKNFGPKHGVKYIIPCIVNGMPFALDKKLDEVFVTDISAISRFFNGNEITLNSPEGEINIYSQWSSSNPSPEDFLFMLNHPFNVKMRLEYFSTRVECLPIGEGVYVRAEEYLYEEKGIQESIRYFSELEDYRNNLFSNGGYPFV